MPVPQQTLRRTVIFLDIDGVLQPPSSQKRFKHDLEELRRCLADRFDDEIYLGMDKYDLGAVYFDWDSEAVERLHSLCNDFGAGIVISSDWRRSKSTPGLQALFRVHGLHRYVTDKTSESGGAPHYRAGEVKEYLQAHPEIERFVIIDDGFGLEFDELFPEQFVHTGCRSDSCGSAGHGSPASILQRIVRVARDAQLPRGALYMEHRDGLVRHFPAAGGHAGRPLPPRPHLVLEPPGRIGGEQGEQVGGGSHEAVGRRRCRAELHYVRLEQFAAVGRVPTPSGQCAVLRSLHVHGGSLAMERYGLGILHPLRIPAVTDPKFFGYTAGACVLLGRYYPSHAFIAICITCQDLNTLARKLLSDCGGRQVRRYYKKTLRAGASINTYR